MALTITVAGAVLSGFAFSSVAATQEAEGGYQPPNSLVLYGAEGTAAATATVEEVYGPVERGADPRRPDAARRDPGRGAQRPVADRSGRSAGSGAGSVTDADSLAALVTAADREAGASPRWRTGGVVVLAGAGRARRRRRASCGSRAAQRRRRRRSTGCRRSRRRPAGVLRRQRRPDRRHVFVSARHGRAARAPALDGRRDFAQTLLLGGGAVHPGRAGPAGGLRDLRPEPTTRSGCGSSRCSTSAWWSPGCSAPWSSASRWRWPRPRAATTWPPWPRSGRGRGGGGRWGRCTGCSSGSSAASSGWRSALPSGLAFTQVDGLPGVDVPWLSSLGTVASVLVLGLVAGWVVTPSRLRLTRRTA